MTIVHCTWIFQIGGAEALITDIINEQSKNNEVHLIIMSDYVNENSINEISSRVRIHRINRPSKSINLWYFFRFRWLLHKIKPDIVHSHMVIFGLFLGGLNAKKVCTLHGNNFYPVCARKAFDLFLANSHATENYARSEGLNNLRTVPNGIATERISVNNKDSLSSPVRILFVARIHADFKGQDIAIKALHELRTRFNHYNISIDFIGEELGSTTSMDLLKSLISEYNLSENVRFLGAIERHDVYKIMSEYDIMMNASRREPFGLTVVEGMAARLPVIVPDSDGPYEIIERGKLGTCFKTGSYISCAESLDWMINNWSCVKEKAEAAYEKAINEYSTLTMVEKFSKIYNEIL